MAQISVVMNENKDAVSHRIIPCFSMFQRGPAGGLDAVRSTFSDRKWHLSDGTSVPRSHGSVMGSAAVGENPRSAESISPESAPIGPARQTIPRGWGAILAPGRLGLEANKIALTGLRSGWIVHK